MSTVFWKKNKKNIINLSFAENAQRVVKVKIYVNIEDPDQIEWIRMQEMPVLTFAFFYAVFDRFYVALV